MTSEHMSQAGPPRTLEGEAAKGKEGVGGAGNLNSFLYCCTSPSVLAFDLTFLGQELINTKEVSKEHFGKGRVILSQRSTIVKLGGTSGKGPACLCR